MPLFISFFQLTEDEDLKNYFRCFYTSSLEKYFNAKISARRDGRSQECLLYPTVSKRQFESEMDQFLIYLEDPEFLLKMKNFCDEIYENHSFQEYLKGIVIQSFLQIESPYLLAQIFDDIMNTLN